MKLKRCRGYAACVDDEIVNEGMPIYTQTERELNAGGK